MRPTSPKCVIGFAICTAAIAGNPTPIYQQNFETLVTGGAAVSIDGQQGFRAEPPDQALAVELSPIDGVSARVTGPPTDESFGRPGRFTLMSPSFSPVFGRFDADIRLSSTAPAFEIATFEPLTGFVNCRILADQGTLRIRGGATLGSFGFGQSLPAIGEYSAGEAFRLGIEALPSGTLRIYLNDSLAFEGEELNSVNFNAPGRMGRWGIWQGTRSGTVPPGNPDGTGSTITIDNVVVAPSPCQMDFSGNGMIDAADLALLLNFWGDCYDRYAPCPADFDHDNKVNIADISYMLASWGPCD